MNNKTMKILAIESSCDETAAAVISVENLELRAEKNSKIKVLSPKILSNVVASQIDIHKKFGGVFPEIASRAHAENIIAVVEEALQSSQFTVHSLPKEKVGKRLSVDGKLKNIDLIAVTAGPGLIGSLLVGVNFAKTLAFTTGKPIIPINHWLGHIYSCFAGSYQLSDVRCPNSENGKLKTDNLPKFPILALIVSGGHTGLVLMRSHTDYETVGETLDDAAGEAFDKVAKLLELGYPGGPAIAAAAAKHQKNVISRSKATRNPQTNKISHSVRNDNNETISFPRAMLDRPDYNFSFSGLKTAVLHKVNELLKNYKMKDIQGPVAAEFQQTVIDILIGKTLKAAEEFKPKSIILCGGVSANKELREQMEAAVKNLEFRTENLEKSLSSKIKDLRSVSFHTPPLSLTGDNAAMIGIAAAYHLNSMTTWQNINADSNMKL